MIIKVTAEWAQPGLVYWSLTSLQNVDVWIMIMCVVHSHHNADYIHHLHHSNPNYFPPPPRNSKYVKCP